MGGAEQVNTHFVSGPTQTSLVVLQKLSQKPIFIQPLSSCTVAHGAVARFHALVSGTPPLHLDWFHNQDPVQPDKNVVFHFDEASGAATLIVVDAFPEHAGQYTSMARNRWGKAVSMATLTVSAEEEGEEHLLL
ncbi:palladin-like [Gouania willdenowi]|uniref:palladin-like n=1 Tax=Gouania willdenowi TaxID=441366 RepID=UPI0010552A64|nr:palladin-like [Gouania willdenowi]